MPMTFMREIKDLCKEFHVDPGFVEELETLIRSRMLHVAYQRVVHDEEMAQTAYPAGTFQAMAEEMARQEMMKEIWKFAKHETETTELGVINRWRVAILTEDLGKAKH